MLKYLRNNFKTKCTFISEQFELYIYFGTIWMCRNNFKTKCSDNIYLRNNLDVFVCLCLHLQNCTETREKRSSLKDCVVEKQIKSPTFLNKTRKDKSFYTKRSYQTSLTMIV